ncbi:MAG: pyridoxal-phosphate dependent enzyme [Bacteroidales bacterium]
MKDKNLKLPDIEDILDAHDRIKLFINKTPVISSAGINKLVGAEIYFKCENFQKVGAFKYRGATNAVLCCSEKERKRGFATHSSGNHAAALSLAANKAGTKAFVVMPENAPEIKKAAVISYGAEITYCFPSLESRETTLNQLVEKTGAIFVHPYNNTNVIAGQGTAALELCDEIKDLEVIIAPVGGGGLLSGTSIAARYLNKNIEVIGAEPEMANDAFQSFKTRKIVPSVSPKSIADGLLASLGDLTFNIILNNVDHIFTAPEASIVAAMRLIWERMKIVVEPSSSVPLAIIMENKEFFKGKKIGIIISGGNVDLNKLPF